MAAKDFLHRIGYLAHGCPGPRRSYRQLEQIAFASRTLRQGRKSLAALFLVARPRRRRTCATSK